MLTVCYGEEIQRNIFWKYSSILNHKCHLLIILEFLLFENLSMNMFFSKIKIFYRNVIFVCHFERKYITNLFSSHLMCGRCISFFFISCIFEKTGYKLNDWLVFFSDWIENVFILTYFISCEKSANFIF